MRRKFMTILIYLIMLLSFSSCITSADTYPQNDAYIENEIDVIRPNASINTIFRYGTPYYIDGRVSYYIYKNVYYYPYYYGDYWYVRAYRYPVNYHNFRPHRYDYRFSPGRYRGFDRPRYYRYDSKKYNRPNRHPDVMPNRRFGSGRSTVTPNKPSFGSGRSTVTPNKPSFGSGRSTVTPNKPSFGDGSRSTSKSTRGGHFGGRR